MTNNDIVQEIDKKISALQQARQVFAGGDSEPTVPSGNNQGGNRPTHNLQRAAPSMSAATRKRISATQKRKWAERKGAEQQQT